MTPSSARDALNAVLRDMVYMVMLFDANFEPRLPLVLVESWIRRLRYIAALLDQQGTP